MMDDPREEVIQNLASHFDPVLAYLREQVDLFTKRKLEQQFHPSATLRGMLEGRISTIEREGKMLPLFSQGYHEDIVYPLVRFCVDLVEQKPDAADFIYTTIAVQGPGMVEYNPENLLKILRKGLEQRPESGALNLNMGRWYAQRSVKANNDGETHLANYYKRLSVPFLEKAVQYGEGLTVEIANNYLRTLSSKDAAGIEKPKH